MSSNTTPENPPSTSSPYVYTHRWPWRAEEFVSMAVAFAVVLGLGWLIFDSRREDMTGAVAAIVIGATLTLAVAAVLYLWRVKVKRVSTSQVTITIIGNTVRSESKGPLGTSQSDISKARTVSYRRFNSDETFMIGDGDKAVRIPLRATADPRVREAVETAVTNAAAVSDEARSLFTKMEQQAA